MIAIDGDIQVAKCDMCGTQRTAIGADAWSRLASHLSAFWAKFGDKDLCHACNEVRLAHTQIPHLEHTGPRAETVE